MTDLIARYIPHDEADKYRNAGWDVINIPSHHGAHSMLATAPIEVSGKGGDLVRFTAIKMGVPLQDLIKTGRQQKAARARQVGMWIGRSATSLSYSDIARAFNRQDHTTVISAVKRVSFIRAADAEFRKKTDGMLQEYFWTKAS